MTTNDAFDRTLSAWLHEDAEHRVPDHLDEVLQRAAATRQRPAWSSLERWLPVDTTFTRRLAPTMRPAWTLLAVLALLVAIALALLLAGAPKRLPAPFGTAANGMIVFEGGGDISTIDKDGSTKVLVGGPTNDFSPWFANDGTRFAFLREEGKDLLRLMAADSDGDNVRSLSPGPLYQPDWWDWSPTGSQLVVYHTVDSRRVISILDADGTGNVTTIDLGVVFPDVWVGWLPPDGREIVFRGRPTAASSERTLFAVHPDGTDLRRIAPLVSNENAYNDIALAPDGSTLLYWNWEKDESPDGMGGHTHLLDLVTGVDTLIRVDPTAESELKVKFSPDGKSILIERQQPAQLMIVPADLSAHGVPIGPAFDYGNSHLFGFSPDGLQVIQTVDDTSTRVFRISDGASLGESTHAFPTWQRLAP